MQKHILKIWNKKVKSYKNYQKNNPKYIPVFLKKIKNSLEKNKNKKPNISPKKAPLVWVIKSPKKQNNK